MAIRIIDDPNPLPLALTPKMVERGALLLEEYGGLGPYTARNLARDVYLLMEEVRTGVPK
jgi:hypothetical protein